MTIQPEQLTLFPLDILDHANPFPMPGNEEAKRMTATSGRRLLDYYRKSGPIGSLVKMLLGTSLWGSTRCLLTWKGSATPRKHLLFRLLPSTPAIEEIESSLWATPQARDFRSGDNPAGPRAQRKLEQGWSQNLNDQVKLWPTPRAGDGPHGGPNSRDSKGNYALSGAVHHANLWPTPKASLRGDCPSEWERRTPDLHAAVKMRPTPAAQDSKNATLPASQIERDTVPGAIMREGYTGQLNPEWVEALMNFPAGWTEVE